LVKTKEINRKAMKQLLTLLCCVAVLTGTTAQTKKGSIVSFHILGALNTELQSLNRKDEAAFDERIIKETTTYLKSEFVLDSVYMGPGVPVKIKTDINRLSGVKRLSGNEKEIKNEKQKIMSGKINKILSDAKYLKLHILRFEK
jgi:hypothetical protein